MALDSSAYAPASEKPTFLSQMTSNEVAFGEGLFHGVTENPINGAVQLINHVSGAHLPEMHLTSEKDVNTTAGQIGTWIGGAADVAGLTAATGGLSLGGGILGSSLKMATIGGVYSGVFQPTDENSKNFYADRLTNAAVTATTFGAMGAAAGAMDKFLPIAVPAGRTLIESMGYNSIAGAAGGMVGAEADAMIKHGTLASKQEVGSGFLLGGAFGAAAGAAGFAVNRLMNPTETYMSGDTKLKVYSDSDGPARIQGVYYPDGGKQTTMGWRTATGGWKVSDSVNVWIDGDIDAPPYYDTATKGSANELKLNDSFFNRQTTITRDGEMTLKRLDNQPKPPEIMHPIDSAVGGILDFFHIK